MRYIEDLGSGRIVHFRAEAISEHDLVAFAREYDPQPIHIDEAYASAMHRGSIASGFPTMLQSFKSIMHELMINVANIGGLGFEKTKRPKPVRPNKALDVDMRVESITPSRTKPSRGVMACSVEVRNLAGELVLTTRTLIIARCRAPGSSV